MVRWNKPPEGKVKVNCDGSYKQITKKAAAGGLLRDEDGRILKAYQSYLHFSSVLFAELYSIWNGLEFCVQNHFCQVLMESDSKVALSLINCNRENWNWRLVNIISRIKILSNSITVIFAHSYREGSAAADWLANDALAFKKNLIINPEDIPIPV